jgi:phosphotransferase system enzyme I (PtsI)
MSVQLKGVAAAPGIAIARLVHFHGDLDFIPTRSLTEADVPRERTRLEDAIATATGSILRLRQELAGTIPDHDIKIYDAQLALLHDATLREEILHEAAEHKINVEVALQHVIARYEAVFERMEDAAMRERSADLRDVGRQVLRALMEKARRVYIGDGQPYVFAAEEFLPSDAGAVDRSRLRGIVTAGGGKYSHGAILARSLGIPSIVAVDSVLQKVPSGVEVIVDGDTGVLVAEPDDEERERYLSLEAEQRAAERRVFEVRFLPSVTKDGSAVDLWANVEGVRDLDQIERKLITGVGLFRTEFAFMERRKFPSEDEQVGLYSKVLDWAEGRPVTFRTLDVGNDKPLAYFRTPAERNPAMGWRGVRISLDWPDLLFTQIRAILRASAGKSARILFPMVTDRSELERCRDVVYQIRDDMVRAGEPCNEHIKIGAMIEVPAAAMIVDQLCELVDFVSVGTNDLVQYALAIDRDNQRVAPLYSPFHPAVLRLLQQIADATAKAGVSASICGEIAGDHYCTPLLIGLGFRELSMSPVFLPRVKLIVRSFSVAECEELAQRALTMRHTDEIRRTIRDRGKAVWSKFLAGDGVSTEEEAAG